MNSPNYLNNRFNWLFTLSILLIHSFGFAQRVTTVAGGTGDGGPALSANLFGVTTVAVDGNGNIYIADGESATIRKVDHQSGIISRIAGNGIVGLSGDGGPAINASLYDPSGVAVDAIGNVYISDQTNHVIQKVNVSTGVISRIAGDAAGASGYSGDNGLASLAKLKGPHALTVDANGNIYFTDTENLRIRRIDSTTGIITTVAGNGVSGYSGDNGAAISASISYAGGVAVDANGNIYIADYGNNCIRRVNSTSGIITTVAGTGTSGFSGDGSLATQAMLNSPIGVLIDANGNLIIADTYNERIRKVDLTTGIITTIVGTGVNGFKDGLASTAQLATPQGLAKDANGNIFISEFTNARIRKIVGTTVSTVAGNGHFGGDGGLAVNANIYFPHGVAIDAGGNIFIADTQNNRIRKIDKNTGNISTIAGDGTGQFTGDGGPSTNARLSLPIKIIFDENGNLFFSDAGNSRIRKIDKTSGIISTVVGNGIYGNGGDNGLAINASLKSPDALAFDSLGNLFIVDKYDNKIRKVDGSTGIITTYAGNGTLGSSGDGSLAINAQLSLPSGITVASKGNLLIADGNSSIRMVNPVTGIISSLVTLAPVSPVDLIVKGDDLYVLESFSVKKTSLSTGATTIIAGSNGGYFGDGGPALNAHFKYLQSFAFDQAGNLFLADLENYCIRKIAARISQTISFNALTPRTYGDLPFDLAATASSGLPVSYTSSNINVASVNGKMVTILSAGNTTLTAIQSGDLDYLPSALAPQTLTINKANQSITFGPIVSKTLGESGFTLNATASSGLDVTYSSSSDKITISGKQISLVKAGRVIVKADQAGNLNYNLALTVEQSFCINPVKPTITLTTGSSGIILTSSNDIGNQWFLAGALIIGATDKTYTTKQVGTYTVQSTTDDCSSDLSDQMILSITAIEKDPELTSMQIYPNPAQQSVWVKVNSIDREPLALEIIDPLGKEIFVKTGSTNEVVSLDVNGLSPGIYFVKVLHGSSQQVERFLKK